MLGSACQPGVAIGRQRAAGLLSARPAPESRTLLPHGAPRLEAYSQNRGVHAASSTGRSTGMALAAACFALARPSAKRTRRSVLSRTRRQSSATDADAKPIINEVTGPILLLVLAVLYGGNVPLLKLIETEVPLSVTSSELLVLRFLAASLLFVPWAILNSGKVQPLFLPAAELSLYLWLGYTLQVLGLEKTSASLTSVVTATTGLVVQGFEAAFERKPFSPVVISFSVATIAGVALFVTAPGNPPNEFEALTKPLVDRLLNVFTVIMPTQLPHQVWLANVPGEALAFAGAFFFAMHVYRCTKIVEQGSKLGSDDGFTFGLAALQSLLVVTLSAAFSIIDSVESLDSQLAVLERLDGTLWLQIATCGILCTGLPSVLELFAFKVVPPAVAALIYCTIPLWGTCLGVLFLDDAFGLQSLIAGVIILVGSMGPSVLDIVSGTETEEK